MNLKKIIQQLLGNYRFFGHFVKAISLIFSVAPLQVTLLILVILITGIAPAVSIKLTAIIIDNVAGVHKALMTESHIFWLCGLWAFTLLLKNWLDPVAFILQGNIADKTVFFVGQRIISKSCAIEGLEAFDSPAFHDTIQLLQSQAHHKPIISH